MTGMLVEEKKLRRDSTVVEVFPELAKEMDARLRGVTLVQLLSHTSGIPSDNKAFGELLDRAMLQDGNLDELRYWLVKQWSPRPDGERKHNRGRENRTSRECHPKAPIPALRLHI
jgi:CubicO group peptidase (beta-lactamase class C family)